MRTKTDYWTRRHSYEFTDTEVCLIMISATLGTLLFSGMVAVSMFVYLT